MLRKVRAMGMKYSSYHRVDDVLVGRATKLKKERLLLQGVIKLKEEKGLLWNIRLSCYICLCSGMFG